MVDGEVREIMDEHDLDEDQAERVRDIVEEYDVDVETAVELEEVI